MKKLFLISVAIFLFIDGYGQTAKEYYEQWQVKFENGDYKGAISDHTQAIE